MVQVKVEHVIVVLLGLFLLYHFMGSCGCNKVEGWIAMGYNDNQPYVKDTQYCGLDPSPGGGLAHYDDEIKTALEDYNNAIDDLTSAQTDYTTAKTKYESYSKQFKRNKSNYETAENEQMANAWLSATNESARLANDQSVDMGKAVRSLKTANREFKKAKDALDLARDNKVAAEDECSLPNRMLNRYGPEIACQGDKGEGSIIDENSFSKLFVRDTNTFKAGVAKRQYDGKKNACAVLTAEKETDYPFNGLIIREDKSYAGDDYFKGKLPAISKQKPAPIQVASPVPSPYQRVDGVNYVDLRATGSFKPVESLV